MKTLPDPDHLARYLEGSSLYQRNADLLLRQGDRAKAGEMLWGAVAELLKAIGLLYGRPVGGHAELIALTKSLAVGRQDPEMVRLVKAAEKLHVNFYEHHLDDEEFSDHWHLGVRALASLRTVFEETRVARALAPSGE